MFALEPDAPVLVVEIERPSIRMRVAQHNTRLLGVLTADRQALAVRRGDDGELAFLAGNLVQAADALVETVSPAGQDAGRCARDQHAPAHGGRTDADQDRFRPAPPELVAVPPRGELRSLWFTDANELEAFRKSREADVVRRDALPRVMKQPLARLDRLPTFFDRRQVPLFALSTDDPQPALSLVERESPSDRKRLYDLVRAEGVVAVETGGVQRRSEVRGRGQMSEHGPFMEAMSARFRDNPDCYDLTSRAGRTEIAGDDQSPRSLVGGERLAVHAVSQQDAPAT